VRAYRQGSNLTPDNDVGTVTFEEFLARQIRRERSAPQA